VFQSLFSLSLLRIFFKDKGPIVNSVLKLLKKQYLSVY